MLPKKKRITKEIFHQIMKNGKVFHGPFFTFYYINSISPRYSFVVPKGVVKGAVLRNKLRRKGYNIMLFLKNVKSGMGIFFYKKEALKTPILELKSSIEDLLKRASITK
jgi:ribonuclease P protein component